MMSENIRDILDTVASVRTTPMIPIFDYTTRITKATKELSPEGLRKVIKEMKEYASKSDIPIITAANDGDHSSKMVYLDHNPGTSYVHLQAPFTVKVLKRRRINGTV